jgi:hypothetical protein
MPTGGFGEALLLDNLATLPIASYSGNGYLGTLAMWVRLIVSFALLLLSTSVFAQTGKRVALVIGNSAYQNTPNLPNPANDAADMSAALKK